jgi:hypothetical protein
MQDDAWRQDDAKKKITSNSNIGGFFRVVTIDTTNKGSRPEIHVKAGRSWPDYRILLQRVDLRDTTNKGSSRHHQQGVLAHVDDDELSKKRTY